MSVLRRLLVVAAVLVAASLPAGRASAMVEAQRVVSDAGIVAWLVQDDSVPVISMSFAFRAGSAYDPPDKVGLANMVSGLLDEGAGDMDAAAFQDRLRDNAVDLGFSAGRDSFDGSLKTTRDNRALAFDMLRLALTEPRFDADAVERIRSQILIGLEREKTDPGSMARREWMSQVFGDHLYGRNAEGMIETVKAIAEQDLHGFVDSRLARDTLIVGVAGDVSAEELRGLLDTAFGGLPAKGADTALPEPELVLSGDTRVVELPVPQSTILFGHGAPKRRDPDWYAATVLNHVLGGGSFTSRLTEEVREKRGLAYSAYSYLSPYEGVGLLIGAAATQNARVGETIDVVREVWRNLAQEGPTPDQVAQAKSHLAGAWPLQFTSTGSIARVLVSVQWFDLGRDYIERRNDLIEAVTVEEVRRLAREMLKPDSLTAVVAGQPEGLDGRPATPN